MKHNKPIKIKELMGQKLTKQKDGLKVKTM
jgi:hypothetical protein